MHAKERFFRKAMNAEHNQETFGNSPNGNSLVPEGGKQAARTSLTSRLGAGDPRLVRAFSPRVINVDKNAAYPLAIDSVCVSNFWLAA